MSEARTMDDQHKKVNITSTPAGRNNLQHRVIFNVNPTEDSTNHIRPSTRHYRLFLPTKSNNRMSASTSSINHIEINPKPEIHIDLRTPSSPCLDLQTPSSEVKNTRHSFLRSSQSARLSHLITNHSELTRECAICLLDQSLDQFNECYSNQCEHLQRTICNTCIYNHIRSRLENLNNNNIICPEPHCIGLFDFEIIRSILTKRNNFHLFERYDRQLTHRYLEQSREFIWCAHNGCGSGQLHVHSNPMLTCVKCRKQTCVYHRMKWHVGMTCEEYDQMKNSSLDDRTLIWLRKHSKTCPHCHSYIQKVSGCDHMTCKRCRYQFCWECLADYEQIHLYGLRQHMKYCSHYPMHHRSNKNLYSQRSTACNVL